MRHDVLSDALSAIKNAEDIGKTEIVIVGSKLTLAVLQVLQKEGLIASAKAVGNTIEVTLTGRINAIKAVRPRFSIGRDGFEKFETRYLPSRELGVIVISTSQGAMTHREAKEKKIGGRILAYAY